MFPTVLCSEALSVLSVTLASAREVSFIPAKLTGEVIALLKPFKTTASLRTTGESEALKKPLPLSTADGILPL